MYRVILIDDEPWALKDFEMTFPWAKYGFHIAGSYTDAQKACQSVLSMRPELVVTDLRMPGMSGTELLEKARKEGLTTEFILVSGITDFNAARMGIRYGVAEYCLKPLESAECEELLQRIAAKLEKQSNPNAKSISAEAQRIVDYIDGNIHRKLTLNDLEQTFHMSTNSLARLFRANLDTTFGQYVEKRRMEIAKRLLCETNLSIGEIAEKVGYSDQNYFTVCFRKNTDKTPMQYRSSEKSTEGGKNS